MQVIIGSADLKANHAIRQHVDIVSEKQKYDKWVMFCQYYFLYLLIAIRNHVVKLTFFIFQTGEFAGGHHGWQPNTDIHGY